MKTLEELNEKGQTLYLEAMQQAEAKGGKVLGVELGRLRKYQVDCGKGHRFSIRQTDLRRGRWCKHCSPVWQRMRNSEPGELLERARKAGEKNGFELLTQEWGNIRELEWECEHGHAFKRQLDHVERGNSRCPVCREEAKANKWRDVYESAWMRHEVKPARFPEWEPSRLRHFNRGFKRRWSINGQWVDCSKCLGRIGLGPIPISRLLAVPRLGVIKKWKREGFERTPPVKGKPRTSWGQLREQRLKHGLPMDNKGAAKFKRIRKKLRDRLKEYQDTKGARYSSAIGCDWETFRKHIENQWRPGMNWENHGPNEDGSWDGRWQIDHIDPISRINLNSKHQVERVNHFTNLRPLWAKENHDRRDARGEHIQANLMLDAA